MGVNIASSSQKRQIIQGMNIYHPFALLSQYKPVNGNLKNFMKNFPLHISVRFCSKRKLLTMKFCKRFATTR